jgi:hypothetical protein
VLTWVAEGKTNGEIGIILEMRPRTVAKHLERIFRKLGVETRTAAASAVAASRRLTSGERPPRGRRQATRAGPARRRMSGSYTIGP